MGSFLNITRVYAHKKGTEYDKVLRIVCDCQKSKGFQNLDCPSCRKFTWHKECLQKAYVSMAIDVPDFSTKTWKCPQCLEVN